MMNRPAAGAAPDAELNLRLRTMRILWGAFLMAVGLFVLVTRLARPDDETVAEMDGGNTTLLYVLAALALSAVVASFVLKAVFYSRAAARQQPGVLQTGFIVAMALCESAVLLGLVGVFVTWNDYAYLLFALGALGEVLHFPRREQLMSAYYRRAL
jgi:F0F1-type ATP synthase membrane subunit c/vacuolar-type H+-ATPase subunit K